MLVSSFRGYRALMLLLVEAWHIYLYGCLGRVSSDARVFRNRKA